MWDITVGGAVTSGENSLEGAHRELLEEIGLDISFQDMAPAFTTTFQGGFDDIYIITAAPDISQLKLQYEEVQAVRWADKEEILSMIENGSFIPYNKAFIEYLFFRRAHCGNFDTD